MGRVEPRTVHQLRVVLDGIRPPVWRRLLVPSKTSLGVLHEVLQEAFGWWDSHLHEFRVGDRRFGEPSNDGWGPPVADESRTRLGSVARKGMTFSYVYDFGDNWEHHIEVEDVIAADSSVRYPVCTGGARACPPDDVGGAHGYGWFLQAIGDPKHAEHDEMLDWVGGSFDPERFDAEAITEALPQIKAW